MDYGRKQIRAFHLLCCGWVPASENPSKNIRLPAVHDEELARRYLIRLLSAHPNVQIVGEAAHGVEAIQLISECRPDVAFLDIEMPGLNAFDALTRMKSPPLIVFVTAYDKYAATAFDANAIDYLLKPVQPARLSRAIEKIDATLSDLRSGGPPKLTVRKGRRIVLIWPKEVVYIAVRDQIVFLQTPKGRFAIDRTLGDLEKLLAVAGFCRISRSAIVNLAYARELLPSSSGTCGQYPA